MNFTVYIKRIIHTIVMCDLCMCVGACVFVSLMLP